MTNQTQGEQAVQPKRFLLTKEAAAVLQVHPNKLWKWRNAGNGPRFVGIGRHMKYEMREIERFIGAQSFSSISERDEALRLARKRASRLKT